MALIWVVLLKIAVIQPQNSFWLFLSLMSEAGIAVNLVFMFLNLIPILPLDGGRILASLLPRRADPEMPPIHQVVDAVLFRRDRVVGRAGDDLERRDVELVATGRPAVGADRALDDHGAFLREVVGFREELIADGGLRHDGLDEARAVTELQEVQLAARASVRQPAFDRDVLAVVLSDVLDVDVHHYSLLEEGKGQRAEGRSRGNRKKARSKG